MRRIIEGKSYNTEIAELIYRIDEEHESSQSWWSLYRTTQGAYFEVAAGSAHAARPAATSVLIT